MIDAERMLGSLVRNALSGRGGRTRQRGRRGRTGVGRSLLSGTQKGALALGALGVAIAAFEHLTKDKLAGSKFDAPVPSPLGPPAAPRTSVPPPPPPLPPPGSATQPSGSTSGATHEEALLLVRAMIAAANADHRVDDDERKRILEALDAAALGAEERRFLLAELESPLSPDRLAAQAGSPELARQVYLASAIAIEVDTPAEQEYLSRLAEHLSLSAADVDAIKEMLAEQHDG